MKNPKQNIPGYECRDICKYCMYYEFISLNPVTSHYVGDYCRKHKEQVDDYGWCPEYMCD